MVKAGLKSDCRQSASGADLPLTQESGGGPSSLPPSRLHRTLSCCLDTASLLSLVAFTMLFPAYNDAGTRFRYLRLRKAALLFVLLPELLATSPICVRADESALQQDVDDVARALGIGPGGTHLSPASLAASRTPSARPTATPTKATTTSLATPLSSSMPSGPSAANSTTSSNSTATQGRAVFAHFIVGNIYNYTVDSWSQGMSASVKRPLYA